MAGRIPQNFIDDLVSRADIVEIINARVPLKKKGREYSACCPFHNEKTPSFTVSDRKQFYHCFGCGAHGTVLGFLMEYENLDFVDAIETLAAEYNLEVPRENSGFTANTPRDDRHELYEIIEQASQLFQQQLKTSDRAIAYLKQRGLTGDIAKTYQLGYAPDGWNFLTDKLGSDRNTLDALVKTGLVVKKDNDKTYDRFRDRIIFPITDRRGRIIGFGGRVIDQGEPKYLNSPENAVFHKGLELYGLYEARQAVRKLERIIIVEGYMDVVALAQHGVAYAVASLGTATTREQIQTTLRTVSEIIFCYDGDAAGLKAAWRALENSLPILRDGHVIKFLFLPEKEDPDSLIRKIGKDAFEQLLSKATPLSEFLFSHLGSQVDLGSDEGKAALKKNASPLLDSMPESTFRDLMFNRLAELIGVAAEKLQTSSPQLAPARPSSTVNRSHRTGREIKQNATRDAIALLIQYPELAGHGEIPPAFKDSEIQGLSLLYQIHQIILEKPGIKTAALLEHWRGTASFEILQKLVQRNVFGTEDPQNRQNVFADVIKSLVRKSNLRRFEILEEKLLSSGLSQAEKQEYNTLSKLR